MHYMAFQFPESFYNVYCKLMYVFCNELKVLSWQNFRLSMNLYETEIYPCKVFVTAKNSAKMHFPDYLKIEIYPMQVCEK